MEETDDVSKITLEYERQEYRHPMTQVMPKGKAFNARIHGRERRTVEVRHQQ